MFEGQFARLNKYLEDGKINHFQYAVFCYIATKAAMYSNWISDRDLKKVFGDRVVDDAITPLGQMDFLLFGFDEKKPALYLIVASSMDDSYIVQEDLGA